MARVSVIIPTHNRAAMLQRAIESARHAGTDPEIVVVDDASTDETKSICSNLAGIVYHRIEHNVGQARARNAGIARSTGEYIAFLDDDDVRLPNSLDIQADMLAGDKNLGFVYGRVHIGDTETCRPTGKIQPDECPTGDIFWHLLQDNFICASSVMVRRRPMEAIGLFAPDILGTEDWDAWLRLAAISEVGAVREPVAIYRYYSRQSGQTSSHRPKMCVSGARTQAKALRSPRGLKMDRAVRRELKLNYRDSTWENLIREGERSLSERKIYYALLSYATAVRLHPRRAARPGAVINFAGSLLSKLR